MTPIDVLTDAFERVRDTATAAVEALDPDQLAHRPTPDANPIGWLVWHLARVQDDHVADVAGGEQVWTAAGYAARFDLPYDEGSIGFGQSSADVDAFAAPSDLLVDYLDAVHERTLAYLGTLDAADLDRVVDDSWDPPVTLGARLVSVVNDDTQHAGQAAYVRGLLGA